jgi:hypothetical protein
VRQRELEGEVQNYRASPINVKSTSGGKKEKSSLVVIVAAVVLGLLAGYFVPFQIFK